MKKIYIIIFIISIIFFSTSVVYATTYLYNSSEVSYDKSKSTLTKEDVQEAIDELYTKCSSPQTKCPEGYKCTLNFKVGDYVRMTPNPETLNTGGTAYTVPVNRSGFTSTITPTDLTLWRVIRKNSDGTIDMVSQYVSSSHVGFSNVQGYANYIGLLNEFANQYQNPTYTQSARHMGYNGQTEFISDTSYFDGSSNKIMSEKWATTTTTSNQLPSNESLGGGDTMYQTDVDLVNTAMGTLSALKCNDTTCSNPTESSAYWLSSRFFLAVGSSSRRFYGRIVDTSSSVNYEYSYPFRRWSGGGWQTIGTSHPIRPIVTLKSWILPTNISGSGTSTNPYVLN